MSELRKHFSPTLFCFGLCFIASCEYLGPKAVDDNLISEYIMECETVAETSQTIRRCMNDEAICYQTYHGISCLKNERR